MSSILLEMFIKLARLEEWKRLVAEDRVLKAIIY